MKPSGYLVIIAVLCTSASSIFIRLSGMSPLVIAFYRMAVSAAFLGVPFLRDKNGYRSVARRDLVLCVFSGFALALHFAAWIASLSFTTVAASTVLVSLSPIFVALFAFCFAMAFGVIWEIYEFSMDWFLQTNMQKYALESGEPLIGQAALMDTMKDLIVDAIGAFVVSVIGYISLKYNKGWLERFHIRRA